MKQDAKFRVPGFDELVGLWSRSLIAWPDGAQDCETWVNWMQGESIYLDLRQPTGEPDFRNVRGLRGLDAMQVSWLAAQEGFAGTLNFDGTFFEWRREIDFQPEAIYSDQGKLWFEDGRMVEEGRDIPYIEHWHVEPIARTPVCALRLQGRADGVRGFLLRVGSFFMYARGRIVDFPVNDDRAEKHLRDYVAEASDLHAAQDLVDCEISQGAITSAGWIIQRSTLPFRTAQTLAPQMFEQTGALVTSDTAHDGRQMLRHWDIVDIEGDASSFQRVGPSRASGAFFV